MTVPAYRLREVVYRHILEVPELTIPAGAFFCITGHSGSGKTTFLKLLNNMVTGDGGSIFFFGDNIMALNPVELRRRAVMVPQNPALFPGTVRQNMHRALVLAKKQDAASGEAEMERLLGALGLPGILDRAAASLSGGEKQAAVIPTVNSMLGMGIVFLPGMMTGQILAGASPLAAIEYQAAIMMAILGSVSLTVYLLVRAALHSFFNDRAQLREDI